MPSDLISFDWLKAAFDWLRARDAGLSATRRAGRAAVVMPSMLALGDKVIGNGTLATFGAFGALAMLLFVDFGGPMRERLAAQVWLVLTGGVFVCLGTLATQAVWLATVAMLVVAFVVLFAGVVSSVLASASTPLLLGFILPVTFAGPVSTIPDRLAGWLMAGGASLIAVTVLWPAPVHNPLQAPIVRACTLIARRMRAEVTQVRGEPGSDRAAVDTAVAESHAAVRALRTSFFGTPYRPTGLTTAARTLVRVIDEIIWLDAIMDRMPAVVVSGLAAPAGSAVCEVKLTAAELLESGAALLQTSGDPDGLDPGLRRLQEARDAMERIAEAHLAAQSGAAQSGAAQSGAAQSGAAAGPGAVGPVSAGPKMSAALYVSMLQPSFRAQELSFAVSAIDTNIRLTVAARRRGWWQQLLGHQPQGAGSAVLSARQRAGAHLQPHSVWLHNSVRGAIALALAVLVARLTGVEHSFWVVLGTLAILRSSAFSTGQNVLRGLSGTVVGVVLGAALILAIGTNETVLWFLLPLAILFAGLAPAAISFSAGQAGFTITLVILYNIIAPAGWKVGLVRIEDVALGCGVSLVVGALFWPRGAAPALGLALADAYAESARYLRSAISFGVVRCDRMLPTTPTPHEESLRAAAAVRRLDDAWRSYLAEQGVKHLHPSDVAQLVTGVAVLRLSADAVVDLWQGDEEAPAGDRTAARDEVLASGTQVADWYGALAGALAGSGRVPDELDHDRAADARLIEAARHDLIGQDGQGTAAAVKMIWTADHINVARRQQADLVRPARTAAAHQRRPGRLWAGRSRHPGHPGPSSSAVLTPGELGTGQVAVDGVFPHELDGLGLGCRPRVRAVAGLPRCLPAFPSQPAEDRQGREVGPAQGDAADADVDGDPALPGPVDISQVEQQGKLVHDEGEAAAVADGDHRMSAVLLVAPDGHRTNSGKQADAPHVVMQVFAADADVAERPSAGPDAVGERPQSGKGAGEGQPAQQGGPLPRAKFLLVGAANRAWRRRDLGHRRTIPVTAGHNPAPRASGRPARATAHPAPSGHRRIPLNR